MSEETVLTSDEPGTEGQEEHTIPQGNGLLATATATKPEAGDSEPNPDQTATPAVRPDNIPKQFWDEKGGKVNVEAMAKSYNDLRAAFNKGKDGTTPDEAKGYLSDDLFAEDGTLKLGEGAERVGIVPKDDPALETFANIAHKHGLTDTQFKGIVNEFLAGVNGLLPEPIDLAAEARSLGKNSQAMISANKMWVDGLAKKGILTDGMYARALEMGRDADGVRLLQAMREQAGEIHIPIHGAENPDAPMSRQEWYAMNFEENKKPGESFQSFHERKAKIGEQLWGNNPAGSSPTGFGVGHDRSGLEYTKKRG